MGSSALPTVGSVTSTPTLPSSAGLRPDKAVLALAHAPFRRLLGKFDLGDQVVDAGVPAGNADAGGLAHKTAAAIAAGRG